MPPPTSRWPLVPLGEGNAIRLRNEFIEIKDTDRYKRVRVQLHAQGLVLRDVVDGWQIKTKKQQICHAGDFLVAEIDAKVGGFGIVPPELDGAIVSNHYFLFEIEESKLDRRFLGWYAKTPAFQAQIKAQGSTNYAAIRSDHVLGYTVPRPPLSVQAKIVNGLDSVRRRICVVSDARQLAINAARSLLHAEFSRVTAGAPQMTIGSIARLARRPVVVRIDQSYIEIGIRSFGNGEFLKAPATGADLGSKRVFWIKPGELLLNIVFAWEGAVAVASESVEGTIGSHRFLTYGLDENQCRVEFLRFFLLTPEGLAHLLAASPGGAGRNRTLNQTKFELITAPVPSTAAQDAFLGLAKRIQAVTALADNQSNLFEKLIQSSLERQLGTTPRHATSPNSVKNPLEVARA